MGKTGVDCLAVAFGTTHGVYLTEPKLDLPRVAKIRDAAGVPLVMHGAPVCQMKITRWPSKMVSVR